MLATRTFPSEGRVFILGHQLGKYDVFKLRTRIGLASADLGRQFLSSRTRWTPWSPACPP